MSINEPVTGALVAELQANPHNGLVRSGFAQRLMAGIRRIQTSIGLSGIAALSFGVALAFCCTIWAIELGVPSPLAIMAGNCAGCTAVASACLCVAFRLLANPAVKAAPAAKRRPDYAAWKLVSRLSVSDASRLWCDLQPGCPATQESIAWAHAMLDAIKRGDLAASAKAGPHRPTAQQEQANPTWHTEITQESLKSWARANGHAPRFLK